MGFTVGNDYVVASRFRFVVIQRVNLDVFKSAQRVSPGSERRVSVDSKVAAFG